MNRGRFRCIHCGDYFNLNKPEQRLYDEGYYISEPDICDECLDNFNYPVEYDNYSDADSGL